MASAGVIPGDPGVCRSSWRSQSSLVCLSGDIEVLRFPFGRDGGLLLPVGLSEAIGLDELRPREVPLLFTRKLVFNSLLSRKLDLFLFSRPLKSSKLHLLMLSLADFVPLLAALSIVISQPLVLALHLRILRLLFRVAVGVSSASTNKPILVSLKLNV